MKLLCFFALFWEGIYVDAPQRLQAIKDAIEIHNNLLQVYKDLDFYTEILPKSTLTNVKNLFNLLFSIFVVDFMVILEIKD